LGAQFNGRAQLEWGALFFNPICWQYIGKKYHFCLLITRKLIIKDAINDSILIAFLIELLEQIPLIFPNHSQQPQLRLLLRQLLRPQPLLQHRPPQQPPPRRRQ
jgi:hypothetical protein